jgi:flagellar motor switch/type III secretory pathway protein FliN
MASRPPHDEFDDEDDDDLFDDEDEEIDDDDEEFEDDEEDDDPLPTPARPVVPPKTQPQSPPPSAPSAPSTPPAQAPMGAAVASGVQFRVACEIGEAHFSLDQLEHLDAGQAFPFHASSQTVYITVNGIRVGEGQLVEVDGRLGVKITRWGLRG